MTGEGTHDVVASLAAAGPAFVAARGVTLGAVRHSAAEPRAARIARPSDSGSVQRFSFRTPRRSRYSSTVISPRA